MCDTITSMPIIHSVVLGIVQGLTEFLPISSSGHLIFIPKLLGWPDQGVVFDLIVHLGSLVAVVFYLRATIGEIFLSFFKQGSHHDSSRRLGWLALASAIPAGIVGLFAGDWIESTFRSPISVAVNLMFWGLILWLADFANHARHTMGRTKPLSLITLKNSLIIGTAQILALFPGVSRSGITITAGLASNLDRRAATRFSFLMSIPIIAAAGGSQLLKIFESGLNGTGGTALAVGFIASLLGALFALWSLEKIIERWSFRPFAIYRVVIGILILVILL